MSSQQNPTISEPFLVLNVAGAKKKSLDQEEMEESPGVKERQEAKQEHRSTKSDSEGQSNQERGECKADNRQWIGRLFDLHPVSFLVYLALTNVNEGLATMRMLCTMNIYKDVFNLEASVMQKYQTIQMSPLFFRIFIGLAVDLKLVSQRKYYIIVSAFAMAISALCAS